MKRPVTYVNSFRLSREDREALERIRRWGQLNSRTDALKLAIVTLDLRLRKIKNADQEAA